MRCLMSNDDYNKENFSMADINLRIRQSHPTAALTCILEIHIAIYLEDRNYTSLAPSVE